MPSILRSFIQTALASASLFLLLRSTCYGAVIHRRARRDHEIGSLIFTNTPPPSEELPMLPGQNEFVNSSSSSCVTKWEQCTVTCGKGRMYGMEECTYSYEEEGVIVEGTRVQTTGKYRNCSLPACPTANTLPPRACSHPGNITNGYVVLGGSRRWFRHGKFIEYRCKKNFSTTDEMRMTCLAGTWSHDKPTCHSDADEGWLSWSSCSSLCGPGVQKRLKVACHSRLHAHRREKCQEQHRICNLKPCPLDFKGKSFHGATERSTCLAGQKFRFYRAQSNISCIHWPERLSDGFREHKVCARFRSCCREFHKKLILPLRPDLLRPENHEIICPKGHHSKDGLRNSVHGKCKKCPIGSYAACRGQNRCTRCPQGYTTLAKGAESLEFCIPRRLARQERLSRHSPAL